MVASAVAVVVLAVEAPPEDGNMKTLAETFLTKEEQNTVTTTVREVELTTSGEIVPMIVSSSHDYPMAAVNFSVTVGLPLAVLFSMLIGAKFWIGSQNMWLFLAFFATHSGLAFFLVSRSNRIKSFFLNPKHVEKEVINSALAAFYKEKLFKTRDENGILIYISVLEQKVWVLADTGINNKIDQKEWDAVVKDLTEGIKVGNRCKAICEAIQQIGRILKIHFPYQKSDTDELHNLIVR